MKQPQNQKSKRGFASMPPEKRSIISGIGGRAAHAQGTAHRFSHIEAVLAGKKSAQLRAAARQIS
jgi:uncharacterized protein